MWLPGVASVPSELSRALRPEARGEGAGSVRLGKAVNTESREASAGAVFTRHCYSLSGVTFLLVTRKKHY